MEWVLVALVTLPAISWWLGRGARLAVSPPPDPAAAERGPGAVTPQAAEVARRVADPDDPAGAFMDGYVGGRYTERFSHGLGHGAEREAPVATSRGSRPESEDVDDDLDILCEPTDEAGATWHDPWDPGDDDMSDEW